MRPRLLIGRGLRVLVWLGSTKMSAARVHLRSVVDALAKWEKLADKRLAHEANPISAALGAAVALGGEDLDNRLIKHLLQLLKKKHPSKDVAKSPSKKDLLAQKHTSQRHSSGSAPTIQSRFRPCGPIGAT